MPKNSLVTSHLSSSQLESLFIENNSDAVVTVDAVGNIVGWNAGAEKLYGYPKSEILEQPVSLLFPSAIPAGHLYPSANLNAPSAVADCETKHIRKDGSEILISVSVTPFFDNAGKITAVCLVARPRQRLNDFHTKVRQLQKLETVGKLAGGIAHDFNNLLTVIAGYNSLLQSSLPNQSPLAGYAAEVERAAERAASLTTQLLVFSKHAVIAPEIVNLNFVVQEMEKMLSRIVGENIRIDLDLCNGLKDIKADPTQISQMLMNLAIHARYAMPNGGVLRLSTANVEQKEPPAGSSADWEPGSYVQITVGDTGLGLDEYTRSHLFEPMLEGGGVGSQTGPGGIEARGANDSTGLEMSIVNGIVSRTRGHITVESELGKGSCFTMIFPAAVSLNEKSDALVEIDSTATPLSSGIDILLVEDENGVRLVVKEMLMNLNYRVHDTATAEEAIQMSIDRQYDLLLTDVIMPTMGGKTLAERLQKTQPALKVLYMSGYVDDSLVPENFLRVGVNFLLKPFSADQLASQVKQALQLSPALAV